MYSGARLDREPVEMSRPSIIVFIDISVYIYHGIVGFGIKRKLWNIHETNRPSDSRTRFKFETNV